MWIVVVFGAWNGNDDDGNGQVPASVNFVFDIHTVYTRRVDYYSVSCESGKWQAPVKWPC